VADIASVQLEVKPEDVTKLLPSWNKTLTDELGMVVHTWNPSYLEDRDWKDCSETPVN
jgi:hypothetical protein